MEINFNRRQALALGASLLAAPVSVPAMAADEYPSRPVRIVVPFTPGGAADIVARAVGQKLAENLKQSFVIDNRPGASGAIAADFVAKSPADGYTLFVGDFGQLAINPALKKALPYQPLRDFSPVASIAKVVLFFAVSPASGVRTPQEFIALLKARPGSSYGVPGVGTPHHLVTEMMARQAGVKVTVIPYNGSPQTIPPLVAGDVAFIASALGPLQTLAKAGKIRLVAASTKERSSLAPDVAPLADALPGFNVSDRIGMLTPAHTPDAIVDRLAHEVQAIGKDPSFVARLAELGLETNVAGPREYQAAIRGANEAFGKIVQELGLQE